MFLRLKISDWNIRISYLVVVMTGMLTFTTSAVWAAAVNSPELVTDRPDQTESAVVVPPGLVQLEAGALLMRDDEGGVDREVREVGGSLLRIGLLERLELRVGWQGHVDEELDFGSRASSTDGLGDAELGAKVELTRESGRRPQTALLLGTSVPVGEREVTSDRFDPSFRLAVSHTLSDRLGLGWNVGMSWESETSETGVTETLSFVDVTAALGVGLTDRWGAFVELFGSEPVDAPGDTEVSLDGGVTFLVRPNLQLDLSAGTGLSDDAPDRFIGVGASVRLPR